jgi:PAS domain S-box-containing protein
VEGIIGLDRDGMVLFANPSATRLLGWSEDELIGRLGHDVFHHSYPDGTPFPWTDCPIRWTALEGEVAHLEDVFWRRDGTSFPCEALSAPLRRDGELTGAVLSFVNVSERRKVDRLKDEFASVVGHELRTPLTSIRASLGLLAGGVLGELPAEAASVLELAVDNTDRLVRLINEILDLERLESGAPAFEMSPHPAAEIVAAAVAVVEPIAAQGEIGIEVEVGDDVVRADRDRVVQTLVNLLGNAVKFSPRGATVTVRAVRQGTQLAVQVSDRGRGVPSEQQDAIFDRFVQVDASDARDRGGTGLGLAIARRIVEGHGGRIGVTSNAGEGATFSFTLPAVDP